MTVVYVLIGGGAGAVTRYLTDRGVTAVRARRLPRSRFPFGTLLVNIVGSLILGILSGAADAPQWATLLIGTGFCGGLTTFSTFAVEAVELASAPGAAGLARRCAGSVLYVALSLALGLSAAALGWALA